MFNELSCRYRTARMLFCQILHSHWTFVLNFTTLFPTIELNFNKSQQIREFLFVLIKIIFFAFEKLSDKRKYRGEFAFSLNFVLTIFLVSSGFFLLEWPSTSINNQLSIRYFTCTLDYSGDYFGYSVCNPFRLFLFSHSTKKFYFFGSKVASTRPSRRDWILFRFCSLTLNVKTRISCERAQTDNAQRLMKV